MFKVIEMSEKEHIYGVFIVNPDDETDRYLITSPLSNVKDALHFKDEFDRINEILED